MTFTLPGSKQRPSIVLFEETVTTIHKFINASLFQRSGFNDSIGVSIPRKAGHCALVEVKGDGRYNTGYTYILSDKQLG